MGVVEGWKKGVVDQDGRGVGLCIEGITEDQSQHCAYLHKGGEV